MNKGLKSLVAVYTDSFKPNKEISELKFEGLSKFSLLFLIMFCMLSSVVCASETILDIDFTC